MYAFKNERLQSVQELLDLGSSINLRSPRKTFAFLEAFTVNTDDHTGIVALLLARPDLNVNTRYAGEGERDPAYDVHFP